MLLRTVIFDNDVDALDALNYSISSHGHEVLCYDEPYMCPLYTDVISECPQDNACGDILLIDNKMSRMTGLEFIQQQCLRGCKGTVKNKAVMSADWSTEEIRTAEQLGCRIFSKPIDTKELFMWLEERIKHLIPRRALMGITNNRY